MKERFRVVKRSDRDGGFYCLDTETGARPSLKTKDRKGAERLVQHKNEALKNPHINRNLPSSSKPRNLLIFENAEQFGLHLRPHLGDLVEQKGSAVRAFETAFAPAVRARECAALMAEQFAFDQGLRNGRAIDGDEGPATARRFVVDCTCGQLLSRTALASNDYRHARGSGFFDQAYGPAYR